MIIFSSKQMIIFSVLKASFSPFLLPAKLPFVFLFNSPLPPKETPFSLLPILGGLDREAAGRSTRKDKLSGEVAFMEVSQHRAAATVDSSLAYLELRSRRLSKLPLPSADAREISTKSHRSKATSLERATRSLRKGSESITASDKHEEAGEAEVDAVPDLQVSFAENIRSVQATESSTRSSRIIIRTPGSTARPTTSALHTLCQRFPTQQDMDEFFVNTEQHHQRNLKEKYNFDFVNENPLPGRYEWARPDFF